MNIEFNPKTFEIMINIEKDDVQNIVKLKGLMAHEGWNCLQNCYLKLLEDVERKLCECRESAEGEKNLRVSASMFSAIRKVISMPEQVIKEFALMQRLQREIKKGENAYDDR